MRVKETGRYVELDQYSAERICIMKCYSLLFVPAKPKMMRKIKSLHADGYIIDLEDSIEPQNKKEALMDLLNELPEVLLHAKNIIVRLNKDNYIEEMSKLNSYDVDFMLPKFENFLEYKDIVKLCNNHKFYALIETPLGMVNLKDTASNQYISGLAFGAEDFTACVGMKNDISYLMYQKSMLITYAKAYGKTVYDTPSFQLYDYEHFKIEVNNAVDLGFDGKMAINPKHISYINDSFSEVNLEKIREIVDIYEKKQSAVLTFNGKVYEKMHIDHMKKIIKERQSNN